MRKICGILSLIIIGLMLLSILFGSPIAIYLTERGVTEYLLEQGIAEEEILSVKGHYLRKGDPNVKYYAEVKLADQPDEVLLFQYDPAGNIIQADSREENSQQLEGQRAVVK